jgi:hypothetical protein
MTCVTLTKDISDFVQRFVISPLSSAQVAMPQLCYVLSVRSIIWHLRKEISMRMLDAPCLSLRQSLHREQRQSHSKDIRKT